MRRRNHERPRSREDRCPRPGVRPRRPGHPRGCLRQCHGPGLPRVRPRGRAGPALRVSGVLRTPGGRLRLPDRDARRDRGRPAQHLALQGAAAGSHRHRDQPQHRARLHPAAQGRQPGPRARHGLAVGQGRLHQPHELLQGPRRGLRAERRPRVSRQGLRLPLDRQPGQRRRRRGRPGRDQDGRLHPPATSRSPSRSTRRSTPSSSSPSTATTTTSTSSPRRSRARRTAGRSSTSTSAPSTPRAPRPWATRSPSSSAGACPTRSSSRWPPAHS